MRTVLAATDPCCRKATFGDSKREPALITKLLQCANHITITTKFTMAAIFVLHVCRVKPQAYPPI
ncbi:hypothetical protein MnTg02_02549 [bacterium MnTg02]|nr:hypothetical protein MnTg02_02549 [bacterium MnTg02]